LPFKTSLASRFRVAWYQHSPGLGRIPRLWKEVDIHWLTSTIKENNNQHDRAAKKPCFKRQKDGRRQRAGEKQSPWGEQEKKQKLRDNPNIKQGKKQEENVANACALRYTGKL